MLRLLEALGVRQLEGLLLLLQRATSSTKGALLLFFFLDLLLHHLDEASSRRFRIFVEGGDLAVPVSLFVTILQVKDGL